MTAPKNPEALDLGGLAKEAVTFLAHHDGKINQCPSCHAEILTALQRVQKAGEEQGRAEITQLRAENAKLKAEAAERSKP